MPFLTIAGATYEATEVTNTPVDIGVVDRAFDDTLRSSVRAEKETLEVSLREMTRTQYQALRTAVEFGKVVVVGGDAVPFGANMDAIVRILEAPYVRDGASFLIVPRIEIRQA